MKIKFLFFLVSVLLGYNFNNSSNTNIVHGETFNVAINDSTEITITQAIDKNTQIPVYYYSKLNVPACNTGECKLIRMTMYWDMYGNYFKYIVPKNEPLTKINHQEFSPKDYIKLHKILNDTASKLKNLKITDLTEKQALKKYKTDANSGASIKIIGEPRIKGAIKTTFTLWHIAHGLASKEIAQSTKRYFEKNKDKAKLLKAIPTTQNDIINYLDKNKQLDLYQFQTIIRNVEINKIKIRDIKDGLSKHAVSEDKIVLMNDLYRRSKYSGAKKSIKKINFFE